MGAKRWDRLMNIYELVERMRCAELGLARVALDEAEATRERRRGEVLAAGAVGRAEGGSEWAMAQATRGYALREMQRLAQVREMRETEVAAAERLHRASQVRMEQVKTVREAAGVNDAVQRERRAQGSSDDRFAAQAWLRVVGGEER